MEKKDTVRKRLIALLIDYIVICVYLALLFIAMYLLYTIIFDGVPEFNEWPSHMISFLTTVLPVTVWFSIMEYRYPYGTYGKRRMGLGVRFEKHSYLHSLLRNVIKFLPWHIGHTGVIAAIYRNYSIGWFMVGNADFLLLIILIGMMIFRHDSRHIGDMLAGSQVVLKK